MFLDGRSQSSNVRRRSVCEMVVEEKPMVVLDEARLSAEMEAYHTWLERRTEEVYSVARDARA